MVESGANDLNEYSDQELMARVRVGDLDAFAALVERHKRAVLTYIARVVGDETEAEDIAQVVFVQVYKSARRYQPTARFTTWLFTIARNLCLNELRRRQRHPAQSMAEPVPGEVEPVLPQYADVRVPGPDTESLRKELFLMIERALLELPETQRTAILLYSQQGLSYEEIAAVLGCSVAATKSLIHRGRLYLRQRLKQYLQHG